MNYPTLWFQYIDIFTKQGIIDPSSTYYIKLKWIYNSSELDLRSFSCHPLKVTYIQPIQIQWIFSPQSFTTFITLNLRFKLKMRRLVLLSPWDLLHPCVLLHWLLTHCWVWVMLLHHIEESRPRLIGGWAFGIDLESSPSHDLNLECVKPCGTMILLHIQFSGYKNIFKFLQNLWFRSDLLKAVTS